jgi:hypothetical protein
LTDGKKIIYIFEWKSKISILLRRTLLFILFLFIVNNIYSQHLINGVVNSYFKVSSLLPAGVILDASEDVSNLHAGDKVILMQMTGVTIDTVGKSFPTSKLEYSSFARAGKYTMLAVKSVNGGTKQVDFTASISGIFLGSEKIQLIKIYETDYATVNGTLTAADWNGNKGGVLALVIFKKLVLNADIDVTGKGFRGAVPDSAAICRQRYPLLVDTFYFLPSINGISGRIGEGNITTSWVHSKGPGHIITGGGGGLGLFAGGGGGGNFGQGGNGGIQNCNPGSTPSAWSAWGGNYLGGIAGFYSNGRVTMGGGGGSSTQDGSHSASKGGDGGGIVIIMTDTLQTNNKKIISNGESVVGNVTAGGGGGGAGGSILVDINFYPNNVQMNANGGNGGTTLSGLTGQGGGGGGGLFWYAGASLSSHVTYFLSKGQGGKIGLNPQWGTNGSDGDTMKLLQLPLNGFLFNSITATDTICEGNIPKKLFGSTPKGSQPIDSFRWLQSIDSLHWSSAKGDSISLTSFKPFAITQTTWYTRKISSGSVHDTAFPEKVFVYVALTGNLLTNRDTICINTSPGILIGGTIAGGKIPYSYQWESKTIGNWSPRGSGGIGDSVLHEGTLTATTYYRRTVTSAKVCTSISNTDTITVLPSIEDNNFLRTDTAI